MSLEMQEQPVRLHLEELRKRLFIAAAGTVGGAIITFVFHRHIFRFLMQPSLNLSDIPDSPLVFTEVTEMLGIAMKISLLGGLIIALPLLTYQAVMFVSPGLTSKERRYLLMFLPGITFAFIVGVAFGFYVLIPPAIKFLLTFNADIATPMIRIGNYMNLMVRLLFWMGVVFETPVMMFVLAKIRVVSYRRFAGWRRIAVVMAFVLGALITPTFDPINQTLVAIPIVVLYELGIWLAWAAQRGSKNATSEIAKPTQDSPTGPLKNALYLVGEIVGWSLPILVAATGIIGFLLDLNNDVSSFWITTYIVTSLLIVSAGILIAMACRKHRRSMRQVRNSDE